MTTALIVAGCWLLGASLAWAFIRGATAKPEPPRNTNYAEPTEETP